MRFQKVDGAVSYTLARYCLVPNSGSPCLDNEVWRRVGLMWLHCRLFVFFFVAGLTNQKCSIPSSVENFTLIGAKCVSFPCCVKTYMNVFRKKLKNIILSCCQWFTLQKKKNKTKTPDRFTLALHDSRSFIRHTVTSYPYYLFYHYVNNRPIMFMFYWIKHSAISSRFFFIFCWK